MSTRGSRRDQNRKITPSDFFFLPPIKTLMYVQYCSSFFLALDRHSKMFTDFHQIPTTLEMCQNKFTFITNWQSVGSTNSWFVAPMNLTCLTFWHTFATQTRPTEFIETNKSLAKQKKYVTKNSVNQLKQSTKKNNKRHDKILWMGKPHTNCRYFFRYDELSHSLIPITHMHFFPNQIQLSIWLNKSKCSLPCSFFFGVIFSYFSKKKIR